jgi:hypothetical protein
MILRSAVNPVSPKSANEKSIAEPIAVRPTKARGAAVKAATKARASDAFRIKAQSTTCFCSLPPAHST